MAEDIFQFIEDQKAQLNAEAAALRQRLAEIEAELAKLWRVEQAAKNAAVPRGISHRRTVGRQIKPNTIMADVMEILDGNPNGLIALDILGKLNSYPSREEPLMRTSLSPQLSRLKQAGFIRLEGSSWKVVNRHWRAQQNLQFGAIDERKTIEAADTAPDQDTSTASSKNPNMRDREAGQGGGT